MNDITQPHYYLSYPKEFRYIEGGSLFSTWHVLRRWVGEMLEFKGERRRFASSTACCVLIKAVNLGWFAYKTRTH
jgi:hypothetical protein